MKKSTIYSREVRREARFLAEGDSRYVSPFVKGSKQSDRDKIVEEYCRKLHNPKK